MRSKFLVFLLVLSLVANAYFVLFAEQPSLEGEQVQEMQTRINSLENENENLQSQLDQNNESLQSYASQLDAYRTRVFELQNNSDVSCEYTGICCPSGACCLPKS